MKNKLRQFLINNNKAVLIIIAGSLLWSLTMVKSGIVYQYGAGFWGPNGHDGIWHIALINSIAKGSWRMPLFAGSDLKNYHLGFDLLLAIIHKASFIPVSVLYFQIIPPFLAFFIGLFTYLFVLEWKKSKTKAIWSVFFVYFGGSFGWVVNLIRNGNFDGESLFWAQQSISTLVNPPYALSLLVLFAGLWLLVKGLNTKDIKLLGVATVLFGLLVQIKVYAGFLIIAGLAVSSLWMMIKGKGIVLFRVFGGVLVLSLALLLPVLKSDSAGLQYQPFWFLETMVATPDRMYWPRVAQAVANYKLAGNWIKATFAYFLVFGIFILGNLGTRIVGLYKMIRGVKKIKKTGEIELILNTSMIVGLVVPLFFIQSGTSWNTIQFFYYSLVFAGVTAGLSLDSWLTTSQINPVIKQFVVLLVVVFTLPTSLATLRYHYLPSRPPAKISIDEYQALNFLRNQVEGVVFTIPFDKNKAQQAVDNPPRPLYLYESTAYVSAYSEKPSYLEDEVNLEITGYDWKSRRQKAIEFLSTSDPNKANSFLKDNKIKYLYWLKNILGPVENTGGLIEKIYENQEIQIFKVI